MPRHEARSIGGQEHRRAAKLIEPSEPSHWSAQQKLASAFGPIQQGSVQICEEHSWSDCIDANARLRPPDCHASELRTNSIQDLCEAALICDITCLYQRSAPKGLDLRYRRAHLFAPAACRNNVRPRLRQCLSKSKPDTAGPADHNRSLVCEIQKRVAHEKSLN